MGLYSGVGFRHVLITEREARQLVVLHGDSVYVYMEV